MPGSTQHAWQQEQEAEIALFELSAQSRRNKPEVASGLKLSKLVSGDVDLLARPHCLTLHPQTVPRLGINYPYVGAYGGGAILN